MLLETDLNREPCPVGERLKSGSCQNGGYPFFVAHAVRARGSDGHQKSVNYSQVVREQVKCKKLDVLYKSRKSKTKTQTTQTKQATNTHHPENKKASSEQSETVKLRFQN